MHVVDIRLTTGEQVHYEPAHILETTATSVTVEWINNNPMLDNSTAVFPLHIIKSIVERDILRQTPNNKQGGEYLW